MCQLTLKMLVIIILVTHALNMVFTMGLVIIALKEKVYINNMPWIIRLDSTVNLVF
ncbi:hypothetical protein HanXRQr2_Chr05g0201381 [Helianthus annuus]|uniref:Uncharacterized protein n=1 Tax=Helianthus annuus TaxID=4232 RepID=A0A9K3NLK7_HELAN|nr:hypothetical protein HanXRQr2_Chr05g0201381 [Helianthus annuus]KAJ0921668.1 hypothetical protein HanPSC8_Chr05g0194271 [Helianthus annuus]